jgi:4,5-dihydroxyphthalate decarboxylase
VHNRERGSLGVAQLKGKKIGIRAHAQTTVTWVRGILSNEYGVNLRDIQWVTFEHGHLAEFPDPKGFIRAKPEQKMVDMLLNGELDAAIIGTDLPDDDRLQPVLPDPHEAAEAWGDRHGMVPINHMMVIKDHFCQQQPELVHEVYRLLEQSKHVADNKLQSKKDLTPFGIEKNKKALELLILYSYQQGLIPELYKVDDLFWDHEFFR